ncbi:MAG: LamG domain-containing protein [Candidatus Pacearchaeota archaeon]
MKKGVRKKLVAVAVVVAVVVLVGVLIYNYSMEGVLFSPSDNVFLNLKMDDSLSDGIASDSSGLNNNAICSGTTCPSLTAGKYGGVYSFNGANNYLRVSDNSNFDFGNNNFTISLWVKETIPSTQANRFVFANAYNNVGPGIALYGRYLEITNGNVTPTKAYGTMCWNNNASRCIEWRNGQWHHLVYAIERTSASFKIHNYYDGQFVNTNGANNLLNLNLNSVKDLIIGNGYNTLGQVVNNFALTGSVDEFKIFNKALTATEIGNLYVYNSLQSSGTNQTQTNSTCVDGDGGLNYYVKGNINNASVSNTDSCYSNNTLIEYFCANSTVTSRYQLCSMYGLCINGACQQPIYNCVDPDGANIYNATTTILYVNGNYFSSREDNCINNSTLSEAICQGNSTISVNYTCPSGYFCTYGACMNPLAILSGNISNDFNTTVSWGQRQYLVEGINVAGSSNQFKVNGQWITISEKLGVCSYLNDGSCFRKTWLTCSSPAGTCSAGFDVLVY